MRKNFGKKPYLYPMPVLVVAAYGENDVPNAMPAAWGCLADMDRVAIFIGAEHKTTENILARKAFTVSMATAQQVAACDYVGIVSGNKEPDKFAKAGFHATKSEFVDAPLIDELPMALECKLTSYDPETCRLVGQIINVCADESILGENGKVDPAKLNALIFDQFRHGYYVSGEQVGKAWNAGAALMKK